MAGPIKKFRAGQLEAAIWLNEREIKGKDEIVGFKTVSLRKSWKDNEGMWRDATIQLRKHDLPKVMLLMQKAMEEILLSQDEKEDEEEE